MRDREGGIPPAEKIAQPSSAQHSSAQPALLEALIGALLGALIEALIGALIEALIAAVTEALTEALIEALTGALSGALIEALIEALAGALMRAAYENFPLWDPPPKLRSAQHSPEHSHSPAQHSTAQHRHAGQQIRHLEPKSVKHSPTWPRGRAKKKHSVPKSPSREDRSTQLSPAQLSTASTP